MRVGTGNTLGLSYSGTSGESAIVKERFMSLSLESAWRGHQQALEYIAKCAEDGDMLAAIERGGNPIAEIALRDSFVDIKI
jgi:hypothetical protein